MLQAYDDVTDFEICDFKKTEKSRYIEKETSFFLRIRKFIDYTSRAALQQKISFWRRQPLNEIPNR